MVSPTVSVFLEMIAHYLALFDLVPGLTLSALIFYPALEFIYKSHKVIFITSGVFICISNQPLLLGLPVKQ